MITRDDWLTALNEVANSGDPDAKTAAELSDIFGLKHTQMLTRIGRWLKEGKIVRSSKKIQTKRGASSIVAAYKLVLPVDSTSESA